MQPGADAVVVLVEPRFPQDLILLIQTLHTLLLAEMVRKVETVQEEHMASVLQLTLV